MSERENLHAQLAQRLFGWAWDDVYAEKPPAYTTDPAATAQVWQWLEGQPGLLDVWFTYTLLGVEGHIVIDDPVNPERLRRVRATAATWPEALCRAALALADALEGEPP